jgi:peptidylprolyl isomerase
VPKQKRNREWVSTRAKAAAAEAARRRNRRRRVGAAVAVGVLIFALVGSALAITRDSGTKTVVDQTAQSDANTTDTTQAAVTVAGKPCVEFNDDLPVGAPVVPVQVGPPPPTLITQDLKEGDGAVVTAGQTVSAQYIGVSCTTGKIFDSSWSRGQPADFSLSQVIPGWQTGIPGMKVGGERLLGIPPDLAYGDQGNPPAIAPGETLWFVVDILSAS